MLLVCITAHMTLTLFKKQCPQAYHYALIWSEFKTTTAIHNDHGYIIESDGSVTKVARVDVVKAQDGLSSTYQVSVWKNDHVVTALSVNADGFAVANTNLTGVLQHWCSSLVPRDVLDSSADLTIQSKDVYSNILAACWSETIQTMRQCKVRFALYRFLYTLRATLQYDERVRCDRACQMLGPNHVSFIQKTVHGLRCTLSEHFWNKCRVLQPLLQYLVELILVFEITQ
jgi:hypothetical protein